MEGVVQTGDYIPNNHYAVSEANYSRSPTTKLGRCLLWGVSKINRVFNAIFNQQGLSAEVSRKLQAHIRAQLN
jgi:hypothetical protein